jgi:predicted nucleic acid-binding protein
VAGLIVLDATVLIAHLDAGDAHHDAAEAGLLEVADQPFCASPITLAEVLVAPARTGRLADAQAALQALRVTELTLPGDAAERLAALRVATELKLPDCCVLLAAEDGPGTVLTFDGRLARAAERLGLGA